MTSGRTGGARALIVTSVDRPYVVALLGLVGVLATPFLMDLGHLPGTYDPDALKILSDVHVLVDSVRRYGEYPLWNPYFGGGMPWAGYVYNPGTAPQSLIYIAAGELAGVKLWTLVIMSLGSYGMYGTCREWLGLQPPAALVGALFYVSSSWFSGILRSGDYDLQAYFALPFVALCMFWLLSKRPAGLLLPVCYMTAFGDAAKWWPIIGAMVVLIVAVASRARTGQRLLTVALLWTAGFGCGLGLAAPKLLPLARLIRMDLVDQVATRQWIAFDSFGGMLKAAIFQTADPNLQICIGIGGVALACCGIVLNWRRSVGLLGILIVAILFALGVSSPLPVVGVLTHLPIFNTMGSYGLYGAPVIVFCACGLAAVGFEQLRTLIAARLIAYQIAADRLVIGLTAAAIVSLAVHAMLVYGALYPMPDVNAQRELFHEVAYRDLLGVVSRYRETPWERFDANQSYNLRKGVGTITWMGNMVFPEHARAKVVIDRAGARGTQEGYRGEVYCADAPSDGCDAGDLRLTYNTIRFRVKNANQGTVVLNQNYDSGWWSAAGDVTSDEGLLAIHVAAGSTREVRLQFADAPFIAGLWIAGIAAAIWCAGVIVWCRRIRHRDNWMPGPSSNT